MKICICIGEVVYTVKKWACLLQVIFALPYFSGQYVLGLTLDLENRYVYWMVKDVNKAIVYRTKALEGSGELQERTLIKELDTPPKYVEFRI